MLNRCLFFLFLAGVFGGFWGEAPAQAVTRLDTDFGLNGQVAVELGVTNSAHAVVVQPDGKIVVAGSSASKDSALKFSLLRFNKDGSLDPTFNGDGSVITSASHGDNEALALGLLSDGRIVAAGYSYNGTDRDFALICYLPDGARDQTFGNNGVVVTPIGNSNEEITAMTVNAEGMITVVGVTEGTVGRALVTARYFSDGVLDSSFGEGGVSLIGVGEDAVAEGIIERKDGSLVISGSYKVKKATSLMLVGLSAEGFLDSRFGEKGVAVPPGSIAASEGYGLTEDSDGQIYIAGAVGIVGKRDSALFRFTKAGKFDTSFGDKGVIITPVSEQDDVLYAVTVNKESVIASGYTTDAATRQFLLITYSSNATPSVPAAPKATGPSGTDPTSQKSIQEVRVNGGTKVQIRRLQWSSTFSDYSTGWSVPSPCSSSFTAGMPIQAGAKRQQVETLGQWIFSAIRQFGDFLLPEAVAADGGTSMKAGVPVATHVVTTAFGAGESVSYAATFDPSGNVIAVGTADGIGASSIVVAQYATETAAASIVDQPGNTSSYINTTPSTAITKTATVTGGEINPLFGKAVTRRGVVFSTSKEPAYSGKSDISEESPSVTMGPLLEGKAVDKVTATVAAGSGTAATTDAILPTVEFVEKGETANGSGYGAFVARLQKLRPGTTYFARAYALTADGLVYYGNQLSFRTADACFIATASFGTLLHPGVKILREFRDTFLVNTEGGRWLVDRYYVFSPPLADCIARHEWLRFAARLVILPCIGFSWLALQGGMILALLVLGGSVTILGWCSSRFCLRR